MSRDYETMYYEQQASFTESNGILTQERDRAIRERERAEAHAEKLDAEAQRYADIANAQAAYAERLKEALCEAIQTVPATLLVRIPDAHQRWMDLLETNTQRERENAVGVGQCPVEPVAAQDAKPPRTSVTAGETATFLGVGNAPNGWWLVPVKLTPEMLEAAWDAMPLTIEGREDDGEATDDGYAKLYTAMLNAAPALPAMGACRSNPACEHCDITRPHTHTAEEIAALKAQGGSRG
jgi:hypothetical protein